MRVSGYSEPFVLGRELANRQELSMASTFFAASLARLFVSISVKVVVVDVFRSILSMSCVSNSVETAIGNKVPTSLRFISQKYVGTVIPSEPSVHLLRQVPNLIVGFLVKPVI